MIVLDASAAGEMLLRTPAGLLIEARALQAGEDVHVPHFIDIEIANALRRLAAGGTDIQACRTALEDWMLCPATRYPHDAIMHRIWELRANFTAYDAACLPLPELLAAPLITHGQKLSKGHRAKVEVL